MTVFQLLAAMQIKAFIVVNFDAIVVDRYACICSVVNYTYIVL